MPVWDGHPEALAAYWYCWDTLLRVWVFAPKALDHQAVANLLGYPTWGPWGSTMVWDSCFILHFARYGAPAYPFITCLDNCYARQHENGFICRESDRENREVYATFPVNPPLFAWAEWEWYKVDERQGAAAASPAPAGQALRVVDDLPAPRERALLGAGRQRGGRLAAQRTDVLLGFGDLLPGAGRALSVPDRAGTGASRPQVVLRPAA